uniref:Bms1-type G domain-containing protein n=1 Tax=Chromera velia CCMP2878 TaxID=1169474 RepID=A0A0G4I958_9ALVE|eukprot:Cvel_12175.t1-p1 / transcript=Cvel_12175.t1 / gene=Cvel_12175 / organism=Chromera_velia_CCMP2878 / gene_product=Pre-rRNA-processing protein TSR1 homolog, putative / transcript_product=Pre-rRNA-processing protein TSR1 homolog, putative / location=Cvel_scaffold786:25165-33222(-) / protein_length=921 / sequence_SO=supercontig / SO=protein_coding / is_pseudo=false
MQPHHHRSSLKQQNKPFKGATGTRSGLTGKRTPLKTTHQTEQSKAERTNFLKQQREKKKAEILDKKRLQTDAPVVPPKTVVLLSFHHSADALATKKKILSVLASDPQSDIQLGNLDALPSHQLHTVLLPPWAQPTQSGESKKQRASFIDAPRDIMASLDICKTADLVVCVFCKGSLEDPALDPQGYKSLTALKLQGLPVCVGVLNGSENLMMNKKQQGENRKFVQRYFQSEFGDDKKFFSLDSEGDVKTLVRSLVNLTPKALTFRQDRGYMMTAEPPLYDPETKVLRLRGYVRGSGFSVRHPVHVTGYGDFLLTGIVRSRDPCPLGRRERESRRGGRKSDGGAAEMEDVPSSSSSSSSSASAFGAGFGGGMEVDTDSGAAAGGVGGGREGDQAGTVVEELDVLRAPEEVEVEEQQGGWATAAGTAAAWLRELRDEWKCLRPYDPLAGDQTWPTEEEMREAEEQQQRQQQQRRRMIRVPKGADEYTRAWLAEEVDVGEAGEDPSKERERETRGMDDQSQEGDEGGMEMEEGEDDDDEEEWEFEAAGAAGGARAGGEQDMGDESMQGMTPEQAAEEKKRQRQAELAERSAEDREFPDEVDTPVDKAAKVRFQKYRGLKSFRTSPWDQYEDLPVEYSRVFEFEDFTATCKAARQRLLYDCRMAGGGLGCSGVFCELVLAQVSPEVGQRAASPSAFGSALPFPLVVSTLFPFERKVTVVHCRMQRHGEFEEPVKSKDPVMAHVGFRRFPCSPLYSSHSTRKTPNEKHRFLRFLHPHATTVASFYAPACIPPCPVMLFKESEAGETSLAAWGSLLPSDPNRLIIKRIVLTGLPFRVHKSRAVVRFMFYAPDDVRWFKPVELHTKKGLRGHIREPLGTHGYMKAKFNNRMAQNDTICMALYKRVFPRWFPPAWGGIPDSTPEAHPEC